MITPRLFRLATLLASGVLVFGLAGLAQAKTIRSAKNHSASSVTLLDEALSTLAEADHDYKGHRVDAMKQIHLALREMGGTHHGRGHATAHASHGTAHVHHSAHKAGGKGGESQAVSDKQLRTAQGLLQQASGEVSGAVLQHVNAAIAQLNTALSIR